MDSPEGFRVFSGKLVQTPSLKTTAGSGWRHQGCCPWPSPIPSRVNVAATAGCSWLCPGKSGRLHLKNGYTSLLFCGGEKKPSYLFPHHTGRMKTQDQDLSTTTWSEERDWRSGKEYPLIWPNLSLPNISTDTADVAYISSCLTNSKQNSLMEKLKTFLYLITQGGHAMGCNERGAEEASKPKSTGHRAELCSKVTSSLWGLTRCIRALTSTASFSKALSPGLTLPNMLQTISSHRTKHLHLFYSGRCVRLNIGVRGQCSAAQHSCWQPPGQPQIH